MGLMTIDWNVDDIKREIDKIAWAEGDNYSDGWSTWKCKQDLYDILWYVEEKLSKCSTYADEEEYVKNHQFQVMWDILKDEKKNS